MGDKVQSKRGSAIEAVVNVAIGFVIAIAAQQVILPLFGCNPTLSSNLKIGACFTAVSVVRSYLVRRFFAKTLHTWCR